VSYFCLQLDWSKDRTVNWELRWFQRQIPVCARVCRSRGDPAGLVVQWRTEEAKLLWAHGQNSMAIRLASALLRRLQADADADAQQLTRLQSLLGKWLACNRSFTSSVIP